MWGTPPDQLHAEPRPEDLGLLLRAMENHPVILVRDGQKAGSLWKDHS